MRSFSVVSLGRRIRFRNSRSYWERRYARGGTSGPGSHGDLAVFKADVLNSFVHSRGIESVIEFGCGDGEQVALASYPSYVGLDVSRTAIDICIRRFRGDRSKSFLVYDPELFVNNGVLTADLALSLDVMFHLVEDATFNRCMENLFGAARQYVVIFSSNEDVDVPAAHVRHRIFTEWIDSCRPEWTLQETISNPHKGRLSPSDFWVFGRRGAGPGPVHEHGT